MRLLKKLAYLLPSRRCAENSDIQEELKSLEEMAEPGELGNLTLVEEDARAAFTWIWLERLVQDLRCALRLMIHNKTFSILVVLSLMLGIGANTALYSFMESILLRPLPVSDPDSLVIMKWRAKSFPSIARNFSLSTSGTHDDPRGGMVGTVFPYPALQFFVNNRDYLSSAFCYFAAQRLDLTVNGETEAVKGQYVSGDYFRGMGVRAAAGRLIGNADDSNGTTAVAVLSNRFSVRYFGEAGRAVGQSIRINDKPFQVVGVAPPEFFGAEPGYVPDVFVPVHADLLLAPPEFIDRVTNRYQDRNEYWIEIMGRLRPGVTPAQAQVALSSQFHRFVEDSASSESERSDLPELMIEEGSAGLDSLRLEYSKPLFILMGMAGLILLIACANIASLLLARALARQREIAVRLSMGAARMRIIRQLLTESVLLALIGGALGAACAAWGIRILTMWLANGRENFTLHAELDWQVLSFTIALSLLTGLLFGLAPSIQATAFDITPALKETQAMLSLGRSNHAWTRFTLGRILVVAQIALSFLLIMAAGLFVRTLSNLHAIELGFNRENVLLFTVKPPAAGYWGLALNQLYEGIQQRLRHMSGVHNVSLSTRSLPTGGGTLVPVAIPGNAVPSTPAGGLPLNVAGLLNVGPAFFATMQIPLSEGREFTEQDRNGATAVAIVNDRFVRKIGLVNPVGRNLAIGKASYQIVGVVRNAAFIALREDFRPMIYLPYMQSARPPLQMTFEMRTLSNPLGQVAAVRQIVRQIDSRLAISEVETQASHIDQAINREIVLARLCTAFAGLALVIACIGLYGTVAFNVERRTAEIGIRVALGAQRAEVVWMVLREVFTLNLAGLAVGGSAALAATDTVKSFLYGIRPNDPLSITVSMLLLLLTGLIAAYIPARRASQIDPMTALRQE